MHTLLVQFKILFITKHMNRLEEVNKVLKNKAEAIMQTNPETMQVQGYAFLLQRYPGT